VSTAVLRPRVLAALAAIVAGFTGATVTPVWTVAALALATLGAGLLIAPPSAGLGRWIDWGRAWRLTRWPRRLLAVIVGIPFVTVYPATALLVAVLGAIAYLSRRAPLAGALLALGLFEFGGLLKIMLTFQGTPGGVSPETMGAAAIDLGLVIGLLPLIWRDRLRSVGSVWAAAGRGEKVVLALLPCWLAVSVVQILQVGIGQGAYGFRLSQAYAFLALAGLVMVVRFDRRRLASGLLLVGGLVAAYAVVRALTGLTPAEQTYAISRSPDFQYGETFRAIGSAESAPALASLVTPIFAFAVGAGLAWRRYRVAAWSTAGLALIANILTYTRISVLAMLGVAALTTLAWFVLSRPSRRRVVAGLVCGVVLLAAVAAAVIVQGTGSAGSSARVQGFVDPAGDASIRERVDTWGRAFDAFTAKPFGNGVGSVGSAAAKAGVTRDNGGTPVTDSSFLKVLVEQGVVGAPLFYAGILGICCLLLLRLRRAPPRRRGLLLASLAGFGSFVMLWTVGEYIEQPGKALAWILLGVALGEAFRPALTRSASRAQKPALAPAPPTYVADA
jgi:hypothetical protein